MKPLFPLLDSLSADDARFIAPSFLCNYKLFNYDK